LLSCLLPGKLSTHSSLVIQDDFERENEGDLIGAAESATPDSVALMLRQCTGVVCVSVLPQRADELALPLMVPANDDPFRTAFTVSVDCVTGTTTGISATDRSATIRALATSSRPADFSRPGHVFPLIARAGGVLCRGGHTEAGVDLCALAGKAPVSYLCEICDHTSFEMLRLPQLVPLATKLGLPLTSIAELQRFRLRREPLLRRIFDRSGSSTGPVVFSSLYGANDNWYVVSQTSGRILDAATSDGVIIAILFHSESPVSASDDETNAEACRLSSARITTLEEKGSTPSIIVHVFGSVDSNVPGNKRAWVEPRDLGESRPCEEGVNTTAHPDLYPAPLGSIKEGLQTLSLSADAVKQVLRGPSSLHVCDRVTAEVAQSVNYVLGASTATFTQPMFRSESEARAAPGVMHVSPSIVWTPEPELVAACKKTLPTAQLVVLGGGLVKLWQYGINVSRVGSFNFADS
jgi:3,4-dihydroxy-2-butanone 4-phosphate synthase